MPTNPLFAARYAAKLARSKNSVNSMPTKFHKLHQSQAVLPSQSSRQSYHQRQAAQQQPQMSPYAAHQDLQSSSDAGSWNNRMAASWMDRNHSQRSHDSGYCTQSTPHMLAAEIPTGSKRGRDVCEDDAEDDMPRSGKCIKLDKVCVGHATVALPSYNIVPIADKSIILVDAAPSVLPSIREESNMPASISKYLALDVERALPDSQRCTPTLLGEDEIGLNDKESESFLSQLNEASLGAFWIPETSIGTTRFDASEQTISEPSSLNQASIPELEFTDNGLQALHSSDFCDSFEEDIASAARAVEPDVEEGQS